MTSTRHPDLNGHAGSAWRIAPASEEMLTEHPDWRANLANWVLTIPGANYFWHGYLLSLIHLRDIPGVKPSTKRFPEAEFEIMVYALDPEQPLPIVDDARDFKPRPLSPVNLVHQFHGVTDAQAILITQLLATAFVDGRLNPDTDWRASTIGSIDATVDHYRSGAHT